MSSVGVPLLSTGHPVEWLGADRSSRFPVVDLTDREAPGPPVGLEPPPVVSKLEPVFPPVTVSGPNPFRSYVV